MNRTIRTAGLLTIFLFLMSASINATLDRIESAPRQNQLAVFDRNWREVAVFHGDLAQLGAADAALPRPAFYLRHGRVMMVPRDDRWL